MQIAWDDTMSTGIPRLDMQHKQLIQKFNEFSDIIDNPELAGAKTGEVLDFLQFYATWHFGQEEECMRQYSCPASGANKQAHTEFMLMFNAFYAKWQANETDMELVRQTHTKLAEWIQKHIVRIDTRLLPCIKRD